MKKILTLIPYKVSQKDLYNFYKENSKDITDKTFFRKIPEYSITENFGNILYTEFYSKKE